MKPIIRIEVTRKNWDSALLFRKRKTAQNKTEIPVKTRYPLSSASIRTLRVLFWLEYPKNTSEKLMRLLISFLMTAFFAWGACSTCSNPSSWPVFQCDPNLGEYSYGVCVGVLKAAGDENATAAYEQLSEPVRLIARIYGGFPKKEDRFSPHLVEKIDPAKIKKGTDKEVQALLGLYEATGNKGHLDKIFSLAKSGSPFAAAALERLSYTQKPIEKLVERLRPKPKDKPKRKKKKRVTEIPEDEFFELRLEKE